VAAFGASLLCHGCASRGAFLAPQGGGRGLPLVAYRIFSFISYQLIKVS
jgi:hypothetical protein